MGVARPRVLAEAMRGEIAVREALRLADHRNALAHEGREALFRQDGRLAVEQVAARRRTEERFAPG
jgi:hypothetical protein